MEKQRPEISIHCFFYKETTVMKYMKCMKCVDGRIGKSKTSSLFLDKRSVFVKVGLGATVGFS